MRLTVRQLSGKSLALEAEPESSVGDLKQRLKNWQPEPRRPQIEMTYK